MPTGELILLHGLESTVDDNLYPIGRKAQHLRARYGAVTPSLDTRAAVAHRDHCVAHQTPWLTDPDRVAAAFATPMQRAREAITADTRLIVGSSFGGAVLLKLLCEPPVYTGAALFLAGAGLKLTPHAALPDGCRAILIHGRHDDVVDPADSRRLARTGGDRVQLWEVGDDHRLAATIEDGTIDAAIDLLLRQQ